MEGGCLYTSSCQFSLNTWLKKNHTPLYMGLQFQPGLSAKVYIKVLEKYSYLLATPIHTAGGTVSLYKDILESLQAQYFRYAMTSGYMNRTKYHLEMDFYSLG